MSDFRVTAQPHTLTGDKYIAAQEAKLGPIEHAAPAPITGDARTELKEGIASLKSVKLRLSQHDGLGPAMAIVDNAVQALQALLG